MKVMNKLDGSLLSTLSLTLTPSHKQATAACIRVVRGTGRASWTKGQSQQLGLSNRVLILSTQHCSLDRSVWISHWIRNGTQCCAGCYSHGGEGTSCSSGTLPALETFCGLRVMYGANRDCPRRPSTYGTCDCSVTIIVYNLFIGPEWATAGSQHKRNLVCRWYLMEEVESYFKTLLSLTVSLGS